MSLDTIFDLASLTKVVATAPAVVLLHERGLIDIEKPIHQYLPDLKAKGTESITIKMLLTHVSGLGAGLPRGKPPWQGYQAAIASAYQQSPKASVGSYFIYSDLNFILLGELVRKVAGLPLDEFVSREFYQPLNMLDTCFNPPQHLIPRIAPTTATKSKALRGKVHDPTARAMGGVAGHAGLFSTANDLARFARMLLQGGELNGVRVLSTETVTLMTSCQTDPKFKFKRGLGWDIDSPYSRPRGSLFPSNSFGHTGWTGTSIWLDPNSASFLILLTSRAHPNAKGNVLSLREDIATLAAEALQNFNFKQVNHPPPHYPK